MSNYQTNLKEIGNELPNIARSGSGRKNEIFTESVMQELKSNLGAWFLVANSDWIKTENKELVRKTRLNLYMRGKYARETYGELDTTVRSIRSSTNTEIQISLYARAR